MSIQQQFNEYVDQATESVSHYPQVGPIVEDVKNTVAATIEALVEEIDRAARAHSLNPSLVEGFLLGVGLIEPEPEEIPVDEVPDEDLRSLVQSIATDVATLKRVAQAHGLI